MLFAKQTLPVRQVAFLNMRFPLVSGTEEEIWRRTILSDTSIRAYILNNMLPLNGVIKLVTKDKMRRQCSSHMYLLPFLWIL